MLMEFSGWILRALPSAPQGRRAMALASRKPLEERPGRLGSGDVVVLRAEHGIDHALEARVGEAAGHAVAAVVDAVEHDVATLRASRFDPRHRALVGIVAIGEIG